MTKEELFDLTAIDPWWLAQLEELHNVEVRGPTNISYAYYEHVISTHIICSTYMLCIFCTLDMRIVFIHIVHAIHCIRILC